MSHGFDKAALLRDGYVEGCAALNHGTLSPFFSGLGKPVSGSRHPELVRDIRPQASVDAPSNTLSSRHGLGSFPFHTDGAHWIRPPRYLVLYCVNPGGGERTTDLVFPLEGMSEQDRLVLRREVWRVRGIRESFWARILDGVCGSEFLRFDVACMSPMKGTLSLELVKRRLPVSKLRSIQWNASKYLVIDNWRVLHARGVAKRADLDRHHLRLLLQ